MTTNETLNRAIVAYKAGRKPEARQLLERILQRDRSNEAAWLWLSGVVETDEERIACLKRVLTLNPDHEMARRGLARLRASAPASPPGVESQPAPASSAVSQPTPPSDDRAQPAPSWSAMSRSTPASSAASQPTPPSDDGAQPAPSGGAMSRSMPASSAVSQPAPSSSLAAQPAAPESAAAKGLDQALKLLGGLAIFVLVAVVGFVLLTEVQKSSPSGSKSGETVSKWQTFTSKNGHFQILMPGKPQAGVEHVDTPIGELDLHFFTVETDEFAYMVAYADYPPSLVSGSDTEAMLDGARDGAVANVNGKLLDERRIKLQGFPGRDIWVEATHLGQVGLAQARIILVGNRLYQVLVAGEKDRFGESQAERCLDSLRIIR